MRIYHNSHLSFIDMLFNALVVFAALFMMSIMIINDPTIKSTKNIDERAKIMVTMMWDNNSADDMDLWLMTPEPTKIGYNHPNGNIANLARDDLGKSNDMYEENGVTKYIHLNKEVINIREKMAGHYVVNAMFFHRNPDPENKNKMSSGPVEIVVQVIEIDPAYKEVITKTLRLNDEGDESTVVSFDIIDGKIMDVDGETQYPFVRQQIAGQLMNEGENL